MGDIYVQDFANLLIEQERTELRSIGRNIENQTTAQIAVLTIDSIGDRPQSRNLRMKLFANMELAVKRKITEYYWLFP